MIVRKNSYANGSESGAETQAVLMSVFRTLKQRGHNPVAAVLDAVRDSLETGRLPPLPASTAGPPRKPQGTDPVENPGGPTQAGSLAATGALR